MALRLIVVPRWAGTPGSDFYPWLVDKLGVAGSPFGEVEVLDLPAPQAPEVSTWSGAVREALGDDPERLARTVIAGHSVGCQAVLRALALLPAGLAVRGTLLVAGWWTIDRPWESILPWIETPFDRARARAAGGRIEVLLSDDDPFTADHRTTARQFEERLGARVLCVAGGKHFNAAEEPAVLAALLELAAGDEHDLAYAPVGPADEETLHRLATDAHVRRFLLDGQMVPLAWSRSQIEASEQLFRERGAGLWLIRRASDSEPIGFGGLLVVPELAAEPQLVYALVGSAAGGGRGTRAARWLLEAARRAGRFDQVLATVDEPNLASVRILEKLGFERFDSAPGAFGAVLYYRLRLGA